MLQRQNAVLIASPRYARLNAAAWPGSAFHRATRGGQGLRCSPRSLARTGVSGKAQECLLSWWTERARRAPGTRVQQAPERSEERSKPRDRSAPRAFWVLLSVFVSVVQTRTSRSIHTPNASNWTVRQSRKTGPTPEYRSAAVTVRAVRPAVRPRTVPDVARSRCAGTHRPNAASSG